VAPDQWIRAQAAILLIVNWAALESLVMWVCRAEKCCFARPDPFFFVFVFVFVFGHLICKQKFYICLHFSIKS
jgi:hypothetical protein